MTYAVLRRRLLIIRQERSQSTASAKWYDPSENQMFPEAPEAMQHIQR
jgi:hypothetical protein